MTSSRFHDALLKQLKVDITRFINMIRIRSNFINPFKLNPKISDCFVCVVRPLVSVTSIVGISPVSSKCPHSRKPTKFAYYKISRFRMIISYILSFLLMLAVLCYVYMIIICKIKFECLVLISETIFLAISVALIVFFLLKYDVRLQELNAWVATLEYRKIYGFETIIDENKMKLILHYSKLYILFVCIVMTFLSYLSYAFMDERMFPWLMIRRTSSLISIYIQFAVIYNFWTLHIISKISLRVCYAKLAKCMAKRVSNITIPHKLKETNSENYFEDFVPLKKIIRNTRIFHTIVKENLVLFQKFINPAILFWLPTTLAVLIINIYLLLNVAMYEKYNHQILLMEIETYAIIFTIIYQLKAVQDTVNLVSKK